MPLNKHLRHLIPIAVILLLVWVSVPAAAPESQNPDILIQRVPDEGIHPRLLSAADGSLHLLYFRKRFSNPRARDGDLYYRQFDAGSSGWGEPIKVSSESFNYQDPIYRAGLAVDGEGRVHVSWFRSRPDAYFYTRSDPQRTVFEPQRAMVTANLQGVDAGADVAAHDNMVAMVWAAGDLAMEQERTVFLRLSLDYGASFSDEIMIGDKSLGACACCGLAAQYNDQHKLMVAYRSAVNGLGRHMQLLTLDAVSADLASSAYDQLDDQRIWELSACPVTTNDIVRDFRQQDWLVFENQNRVALMNITADTDAVLVAEPPEPTRQKHPSVAFDEQGNRLVVWGEGISFTRGGELHGVLQDESGMVLQRIPAQALTIPDNSNAAVAARPGGGFLVLF